jgi:hypothetical protein
MDDELAHIVNRTSLIESLLNQAIVEFCNPEKVEFDFFWTVLLNSSIMTIAGKVKVANAISQRLNTKLDNAALQDVMKYRNAFAHHRTNSHPVITVGAAQEVTQVHYTLLIISQSGKVTNERREDALARFDSSCEAAKKSLVGLIDQIRLRRADAAK